MRLRNRRGWNPYAPHHEHGGQSTGRNANRNYGVVYGYPFYPFSYGWNPGWYGTGYGNYYNNYPSTGFNFDSDSGAYPQPSEDVRTEQTVPTVPTYSGAPGGTAHAVVANSVDKSPALIAANGTVNQAQAGYNDARERALANLRQQPTYQSALARRHAAAKDVRVAKASDGRPSVTAEPSNAVVAAATAKLEAGDEVTKMEEQAVANDPAAAAAKARLEQATVDRDTLKAQLTDQYQGAVHGG